MAVAGAFMSVSLWKRYVALLVVGAVLGGTGVLLVYGREMEQMLVLNQSLKLLTEKLREENEVLRQSQRVSRKQQDVVIEEIRVVVLDPKPHPTIEVQVVRHLEKDLASLKGKKVEQVAGVHEVLHEMLRRREYVVDDEGTMAEVRVKTVAISRDLFLFVTVEMKREGT
jgi:hypothetical protein